MDNRFIILIGSYNNEEWVHWNLDSVIYQTHKNFKVVYYNACSTDKTGDIAAEYAVKDDRIVVATSGERMLKTWFFEHATKFHEINDNDIVCILDGDDALANEEVLNYLNEVYNKTNCWMTYGGMIVWNGGDSFQQAFPQNSLPSSVVFRDKLYRRDVWRYSHMRTCRGFLWNRINKKDFISEYDGKYITLDDLVTMYPCLEMCREDKVFRVDQNTYIWNNSKTNESRGCAENKVENIGQIYEKEIRSRPSYPEVGMIYPTLAGGLGNQMFEVAAAASLAKDNNAVVAINPEQHILPNQGRNVKNYLTNIFSKIVTDPNPKIDSKYSWDKIGYKKIPYSPNLQLGGHYQSYKYFDHNRKYIQELFIPDQIPTKDITAIQVRRGDYYKFPDHHPLLTSEYYAIAVKKAGSKNIDVFSDDIQWCKDNLKFENDVQIQYKGENEDWVELIKMSRYKNIVISNSSFGWWAAYLNTREDKQIFVPDPWFGKALIDDGFQMDDLILPEWNRIQL